MGASPEQVIDYLKRENAALKERLAVTGQPAGPTIPIEVIFASQVLQRYQDATMPHACGSLRDPIIIRRETGADELMAVGAACDLLVDFFDRHNHKKTAATRPAAGEPTG
ncbi:MAG: hypothetical protein A3E01_03075 [Gammaproteobacteria bacterium RIFCSPHIGHO2_12_FULL_63_22]|nr:MAG: hypothetical protein A3E01_03075 [Gammaproteobacteria bacterium RIFCSPHIGHO2_12_FULL_63_22]